LGTDTARKFWSFQPEHAIGYQDTAQYSNFALLGKARLLPLSLATYHQNALSFERDYQSPLISDEASAPRPFSGDFAHNSLY